MYNAVSLSARASNLQPLASPIIPTRKLSIQETMETIGIPNNDFSPKDTGTSHKPTHIDNYEDKR